MHLISHQFESATKQITATFIGYLALDWITKSRDARVFGRTSRCAFVKTENHGIIFISGEPFRGPLTMNVPRMSDLPGAVRNGFPIQMSDRGITFPGLDLTISLESAAAWKAPQSVKSPNTEAVREYKRSLFCNKSIDRNSTSGLAPLIPYLVESSNGSQRDLQPIQTGLLSVYRKLTFIEEVGLMDIFYPLFGAGDGLTTSGDDFVLGFLLTINRWGSAFTPRNDFQDISRKAVLSAYSRTNTLSANLIECASQGQSDERLVNALDWLVCGNPKDQSPLDDLLTWGNSSGVDVFVGYLFALRYLENRI